MNNKANPEKYRKLSIVALVTGISAFIFAVPILCVWADSEIPTKFLIIFSFYLIFLPIPAIVCGSIDLKRIRSGRYSNIGKGFDITGIVLGGAILFFVFFYFL